MIGSTRQVRVFAYNKVTDLRKGFDGLSALVSIGMSRDPLDGELYVFINRTRHLAKVLFWDGTGLCVLSKRLEQGKFSAPWEVSKDKPMQMTITELQLLLEGSRWVGKISLSPPPFSHYSLVNTDI